MTRLNVLQDLSAVARTPTSVEDLVRVSRRRFCELAAGALSAFAGLRCGDPAEPTPTPDGVLPSLGGAPDTHEGRTIAAFVDTIVPHAGRDPDGVPGGLEAEGPAMFFDPDLPAAPLVGTLVLLLDSLADEIYPGAGRFAELGHTARDRVLELGVEQVDQLDFAIQLAKISYLSSPVGAQALGYPGANNGYVDDADFSFRRAMSRTITADGNLD